MSPAPKAPDESTYGGRFASRLRALRMKAGLTVQEAAELLSEQGLPLKEATYYSWESGRSTPPLNAFPILAKVLKLGTPRSLLPNE